MLSCSIPLLGRIGFVSRGPALLGPCPEVARVLMEQLMRVARQERFLYLENL